MQELNGVTNAHDDIYSLFTKLFYKALLFLTEIDNCMYTCPLAQGARSEVVGALGTYTRSLLLVY